MWQKRGAVLSANGGFEGETLAELFAAAGMPLTPADNSRIAGWNCLREYLAPRFETEKTANNPCGNASAPAKI